MITAGQALALSQVRDESYLNKMERAIRTVAMVGYREVQLKTGLKGEAWRKQEMLYSGFDGSLPKFLVEALTSNGFKVDTELSHEGVTVTISW